MKYPIIFLLIIFAFAACSDDEPPVCEEVPEPFRFTIVDQSGNNQLTRDNTPVNTWIFYLRDGVEVALELEFKGSNQDIYGVSEVLSLISGGRDLSTYFLQRDSTIDTLFVQVSGDNCTGYAYNEVTFNGIPATVDTIAEVPVFVLVE